MAQTADIHVKIDPAIKNNAGKILDLLGITPSQLISSLYRQIIYTQSIPFEIRLPNKDTLQAIEELEAGKGVKFSTVDELFEDLES